MPRDFVPPTECPVCGEAVPRTARACPGCGADERSGWDEEATRYDGLDLPDPADAERETKPPRRRGRDWLTLAVTGVVLLAVILTFIFR